MSPVGALQAPVVSLMNFTGRLLGGLWPGGAQRHPSGAGGRQSKAAALQKQLKGLSIDGSHLVGRQRTVAEAAKAWEHAEGYDSLTGRWRKDAAASDTMDEMCDMVSLPWVLRQALKVLSVLEVEDGETHFKTVLKAGGVMDVVERYPWSGEAVTHSRRDKRRGTHTGRVVRTESGPCIQVTWDDPYGGVCADTFLLSEDGHTLTQLTEMTVGDRSTVNRAVFRRVHDR